MLFSTFKAALVFSCYALALVLVKKESTNLEKVTSLDGTEIDIQKGPKLVARDWTNNHFSEDPGTQGNGSFPGIVTYAYDTLSTEMPSGRYYGGSRYAYSAGNLSPDYQVNPHEFWGGGNSKGIGAMSIPNVPNSDFFGYWGKDGSYRYKYYLVLDLPDNTTQYIDVYCLCMLYQLCSCENVYPRSGENATAIVEGYFNELPHNRYVKSKTDTATVYLINGTLENGTQVHHYTLSNSGAGFGYEKTVSGSVLALLTTFVVAMF